MTSTRDIKIYRAYVEARASRKSLASLLVEFGISRSHLYDVIKRVKDGNMSKIRSKVRKDVELARLSSLWKHKWKPRVLALADDRKAETVAELRAIIKGMSKDKFPQTHISKYIGKDRSTIIHHLS